jgi:AraC-like DNA-binding protein
MDTGVLTRRHDAAIEDIERSMDVLKPFALRSGAATHGESLRELKQADDKSLAPAKNLIIAVSALINAVDSALLGDPRHARAHLCAASASLGSEATPAEPASPCEHLYSKRSRDGLAPWQIRCVTAHIEEHLSESIHCADLSTLIKLSLSHFMRALSRQLRMFPARLSHEAKDGTCAGVDAGDQRAAGTNRLRVRPSRSVAPLEALSTIRWRKSRRVATCSDTPCLLTSMSGRGRIVSSADTRRSTE